MFEAVKALNRKLRFVTLRAKGFEDGMDLVFRTIDGGHRYRPERQDATFSEKMTEALLLRYIHESADRLPLCLAFSKDKNGANVPMVYDDPVIEKLPEIFGVPFGRVYLIASSCQDDDITFAFADDDAELLKLLSYEASLEGNQMSIVELVEQTPSFVSFNCVDSDGYKYISNYDIFGYYEIA